MTEFHQDDLSLPIISIDGLPHFIGMGITSLVFPLDEERVLKHAFTCDNAFVNNEKLADILVERTVYQRLGTHPRICKYISSVQRGIVLERLGVQLRRRLYDMHPRQERLSNDQAFKWSCQITEGMAYLHHKGVIQGDFGAHNILLDKYENLKLTDFGGSSIDGSQQLVCYEIRSERWNGLEESPSIQNELFALGSTIYEIWTTVRPYHDLADDEVAKKYKIQCFPQDTGDLPVGNIILGCWCGKYNTADEVLADLKRLIPMKADRAGTTEKEEKAEKVQINNFINNLCHPPRMVALLATTIMTGFIVVKLIRSHSS